MERFYGVGQGSSVALESGIEFATAEANLSGKAMVMISPSSVALFVERPSGSPRNSWLCRIRRVEYLDGLARVSLFGPLDIYCLLYTSPSPRDMRRSRMPSSA